MGLVERYRRLLELSESEGRLLALERFLLILNCWGIPTGAIL